jgi:hypothetical protein
VPQAVLVSELVSPDDDVELTRHRALARARTAVPILAVPAMGATTRRSPARRAG